VQLSAVVKNPLQNKGFFTTAYFFADFFGFFFSLCASFPFAIIDFGY